MKTIITLFAVAISTITALAQTSYNSPESIEFDYNNNRWLIANRAAGNILARSSATGALSVFTTAPSAPYGIEIVGNVLYVNDGGSIKGYDLTTAAQVFNVNVGGSFLNGLTHDDSGNLYATDFTAKKIFRVNIATQQFTTFVTGLAKSPNGIIFDQPNNRCVFVNWGNNAPVMAVNLADSTTSTLTNTTLSNCDGIAKDGAGNYYVSLWGLQGISKFNNSFTGGPTTVVSGLSNPADIFYNTVTDTLGVPNAGSGNTTSYHFLGTPGCAHNPTITPADLILCPNTGDTLFTQEYDGYQWYKDGNLLQGATNQFYVVDAFTDAGSMFSVEATENGCAEMSPEVLVDGWAFLGVTVITEGLKEPLCAGQDTLLLIINQPYTTNIQWTKGTIDIPNATDDTLVVTTSGVYSVSGAPEVCPNFVQNLGLELEYNFINCENSIGEVGADKLSIYPNPANEFITITNLPEKANTYSLCNMVGQVVLSGNIAAKNQQITVGGLPAGVYILTVNGVQPITAKVIIE